MTGTVGSCLGLRSWVTGGEAVEDLVGAPLPEEGSLIVVPVGDPAADGGDEVAYGAYVALPGTPPQRRTDA
jgi:hypothetical protein